MEDDSELPLSCLEVDDSLEGRLQAHGLSRRNVKSIIRSVFTDENVVKLLEGNEGRQELDIPYAPVTRSKRPNEFLDDSFECDISDFIGCSAAKEDLLKATSLTNENTNASSVWTEYNDSVKHTAFHADDDAYIDENGEFDWKNWLNDIDNEETTASDKAASENSDSDPDYNFLEDLEERDEEDYRFDRTTKISKKELKSLCKKRRMHIQTSGRNLGQLDDPAQPYTTTINSNAKRETIDTFLKCATVRDKLAFLRCNLNMPIPKKRQEPMIRSEYLSFNNEQMNELKQQMQQHVQLLAQTCLLDITGKTDAKCLLQEIGYFKTISNDPLTSFFNVANVDEAIDIAANCGPCSVALERENPIDNEIQSIMQCIAGSCVFMYRELLPRSLNVGGQVPHKTRLTFHEDCLIAHGCYEMASRLASATDLTQQFLLPCRSTKEIRNRIKGVIYGRLKNFASNPIFKLKTFGVLPEPCKLVNPVAQNNIMKPIDMCGDLPRWLVDIMSATYTTGTKDSEVDSAPVRSKISAKNLRKSYLGSVSVFWTKEMDKTILQEVQCNNGLTKRALNAINSSLPTRTHKQIKRRFQKLMQIYNGIYIHNS